jgi:hypothetical protein
MVDSLTPLLSAGLGFVVVLFLQRWINRHLRGVALLLMGNSNWSTIVYAIILFPGVLLHEISHWVTAQLLGVRTGRFSVLPQQMKDGSLRLGYVEYYKDVGVGPLRESMIGGAPLIFGIGAILLIGSTIFGVTDLAPVLVTGDVTALALVVREIFDTNDFWLWLYLIFAVSNAMMPSASDRKAWPAFLALAVTLTVILYAVGFWQTMGHQLAEPLAVVCSYLAMAFAMTIAVDLLFIALIAFLEWGLGRLRGQRVEYNTAE